MGDQLMTYAIGDIIFGINLTEDRDIKTVFGEEVDQEDLDAFLDGKCETSYSGNGTSPCYFGIDMDSLDECSNTRGKDVISQMIASDNHRASYQALLDNFLADESFSESFREIVKNTEPQVWLLWGSS